MLTCHRHLMRALAVAVAISASNASLSALKTAAGAGNPNGGFAGVSTFLNNLGTYMIYLGAPIGVLAFIAAGGMLAAGNPDAPGWMAKAAIGVGIIFLAKGIMA